MRYARTGAAIIGRTRSAGMAVTLAARSSIATADQEPSIYLATESATTSAGGTIEVDGSVQGIGDDGGFTVTAAGAPAGVTASGGRRTGSSFSVFIEVTDAAANGSYPITVTAAISAIGTLPGTFTTALDGGATTYLTILGTTASVWTKADGNGSGSVTVTTLAAHHVAGTFTFTGVNASGASGPRVTGGTFDFGY